MYVCGLCSGRMTHSLVFWPLALAWWLETLEVWALKVFRAVYVRTGLAVYLYPFNYAQFWILWQCSRTMILDTQQKQWLFFCCGQIVECFGLVKFGRLTSVQHVFHSLKTRLRTESLNSHTRYGLLGRINTFLRGCIATLHHCLL